MAARPIDPAPKTLTKWPGPEAARPFEHRVVGDAGGFGQSGQFIGLFLAPDTFRDGVDLPAELLVDRDEVGEGAGNRKTDLLEIRAVVRVTVAARNAAAAPDHLLDGDHVAGLEQGHFLADLRLPCPKTRDREWSGTWSDPDRECSCPCRSRKSACPNRRHHRPGSRGELLWGPVSGPASRAPSVWGCARWRFR